MDKIYFEKHGIPYTLPGLKNNLLEEKRLALMRNVRAEVERNIKNIVVVRVYMIDI